MVFFARAGVAKHVSAEVIKHAGCPRMRGHPQNTGIADILAQQAYQCCNFRVSLRTVHRVRAHMPHDVTHDRPSSCMSGFHD